MGQGDFKRTYFDFSDKELVELSTVMNKSAEYLDKYDNEQKIFFQKTTAQSTIFCVILYMIHTYLCGKSSRNFLGIN